MTDRIHNRSTILSAWIELIRLPNIFTIPGDILAGVFLAGINTGEIHLILPVIIISFFLYISGLMLNDYFDRETDKLERPSRPIPSGRVKPESVLTVSLVLIGIALALSLMATARILVFRIVLIIVFLVFSYNAFARKIPLIGFIVMGLCRGFNVILGASICAKPFDSMVLGGAGIETIYITIVSAIAYNEINPALHPFNKTDTKTKRTHVVGTLIRYLILVQFILIAVSIFNNSGQLSYSLTAMAFLLLLFFVSRLASKKYYGS